MSQGIAVYTRNRISLLLKSIAVSISTFMLNCYYQFYQIVILLVSLLRDNMRPKATTTICGAKLLLDQDISAG